MYLFFYNQSDDIKWSDTNFKTRFDLVKDFTRVRNEIKIENSENFQK